MTWPGRSGFFAAVAAASIALAAAGCGPGSSQQAATKAMAAAARRSDVRYGRVVLSSRVEQLPFATAALGAGGSAGDTKGGMSAPAALDVILDPAHGRAALLAPARATARLGLTRSGGRPALVLFDGTTTYVRRADLNAIGARPWYKLDTSRIVSLGQPSIPELAAPRTLGDLAVLNPVTVLRQALGALTGSVKERGRAAVEIPGGGATVSDVQFTVNTSLDKTARQLHQDAKASRHWLRLLHVFAAHSDINPMSVWVGADGRIDRLQLDYEGRPVYGARIGSLYDLTLAPVPARAAAGPDGPALDVLAPPPASDVVEVVSLAEVRAALDQWGAGGGPS